LKDTNKRTNGTYQEKIYIKHVPEKKPYSIAYKKHSKVNNKKTDYLMGKIQDKS
jgi:hypothetical protein